MTIDTFARWMVILTAGALCACPGPGPGPKPGPTCTIPRECQPIDNGWPSSVQDIERDEEWTVYYTRLAFMAVKPNLPPDVQPKAEADFESAMATLDDLNDAYRHLASATVDVNSADYQKALQDMEAAVQNLLAIVTRYQHPAAAVARNDEADKNLTEANKAHASLRSRVLTTAHN